MIDILLSKKASTSLRTPINPVKDVQHQITCDVTSDRLLKRYPVPDFKVQVK